ncbi:hypothetical protein [Comamonas sp. JC664]|uniref:hypothetical protein n=1 Tax=Comamonas sp. JC664 TaxID=2801917 RepID=UPI003607451E
MPRGHDRGCRHRQDQLAARLDGDFRVNLQVSDGKGLLASQAFSIHVLDGNLPPQITSQFPAKVPAGVSSPHQVTATDPERGPLQYTLGSQAAGISINASGGIYWTNPEPGTYPLVIQSPTSWVPVMCSAWWCPCRRSRHSPACGVDGHRGPALYLPGAGQRPRW